MEFFSHLIWEHNPRAVRASSAPLAPPAPPRLPLPRSAALFILSGRMAQFRLRWWFVFVLAATALLPLVTVGAAYALWLPSAEPLHAAILFAALVSASLLAAFAVGSWLATRFSAHANDFLRLLSPARRQEDLAWSASSIIEVNEIGEKIRELGAALGRQSTDLDEANAVFAATFKQSLIPLAITKPPGGVFLDVSDSWASAFGYSRERILNAPARDLDMFVDVSDFDDLARQLAAKGVVRDYAMKVKAASGEIRTVLVSCLPLRISAVDCVLTSFMDLTERLAAEAARLESEQRYRVMVETMAEGVVLHSSDGAVASCNKAAEAILGVTEAQLRGLAPTPPEWLVRSPSGDIIPEDQFPSAIAIRTGLPCVGQHIVVIRPDGTKRDISVNAVPLESAALGGRGSLVTIADRTSEFAAADALHSLTVTLEEQVQQRTEELLAANSELKAFSYSVSHDLRSPLRAIDGFAQLLNDRHGSELSPEAKRHLDRVLQSAKRMNTIIDDLLLLARVTQADLDIQPVDISAAAQTVAEAIRANSTRNVVWEIEPNIILNGDAGLMKVVLENLLGNAWKYSAKTDAAHISLRRIAPASGEWVGFVIDDNGAGFDQQYVGQLFSPFRRLHAESEFPGSGIGLATVKRVITRHGGNVRAEGTPGQGAKFWVSLPRVRRDNA
jgi:PAS domain S-box-containing protein